MAQAQPLSTEPDLIQSGEWAEDDDGLVWQGAQRGIPAAVAEAKRRGLNPNG